MEFKDEIIYFGATWCGPCKIVKATLKELSGIAIQYLDIEKHVDLANKYNVSSVPTLLIFRNGELKNRFVGIVKKEKLIKEFE